MKRDAQHIEEPLDEAFLQMVDQAHSRDKDDNPYRLDQVERAHHEEVARAPRGEFA